MPSMLLSAQDSTPENVIDALETAGIQNATITEIVPGIEDVFLELMKRKQ